MAPTKDKAMLLIEAQADKDLRRAVGAVLAIVDQIAEEFQELATDVDVIRHGIRRLVGCGDLRPFRCSPSKLSDNPRSKVDRAMECWQLAYSRVYPFLSEGSQDWIADKVGPAWAHLLEVTTPAGKAFEARKKALAMKKREAMSHG